MGRVTVHNGPSRQIWALVRRQHGLVTRRQLLERGLSHEVIDHRLKSGRLHRVHRGVYAVGRPDLARPGELMAAVLACGEPAVLSYEAAAEHWGVAKRAARIDITVPPHRRPHPASVRIRVHRRNLPEGDITERSGIPATTPARTLIDLATRLDPPRLERAVNEADKLDLIDPESLRSLLGGQRGAASLRALLDRRTFALTDSELERRFLGLVREARLPLPQTGVQLNGFRVDFHWPDHRLVVETDGLRYHRTPAQQARDRERDHAHLRAGLTPLRFTHAQVAFDKDSVVQTLRAAASAATP